ncbi:MAG: thioredoxin domain-containing protein [Pseudomonadota bacterium]
MYSKPKLPNVETMWRQLLPLAAAALLGLTACGDAKAPEAKAEVDMSLPRAEPGTDFTEGYEKTELGWVTGAKDAPVTVIEYGSFTCGGCAGFHYQIEPQLMEEFVKTGYVQFEFRSFTRNEPDILATLIAECLGPTKFKGIKNLYFTSIQKWLKSPNPNDYVAEMARKAGVSSAAFRRCATDTEQREKIAGQTQEAQKLYSDPDGYFRTPSVIIGGQKVEGGNSWDGLSNAIEGALRS